MKNNGRKILTVIILLAVAALTACDEQVTRQMIQEKDFREWFFWRFIATSVIAILIGVIVWLIIRQFEPKAPATHTNREARIVFSSVLGFISLTLPTVLWLEAYLRMPFSIKNISLSNYFFLLMSSYYTWGMFFAFIFIFYLVVMVLTRFVGSNRDCRFAFLPI